MKKRLFYLIVVILAVYVILFMLFAPLNRIHDPSDKFFDQTGTTWKSDNPKIEIGVYTKDYPNYQTNKAIGTIEIGNEVINTEFYYTDSGVITFRDIDKSNKGGYLASEIEFIVGNCDFSRKKLEIEVTSSLIDEIKIGDKIILYQQD